MTEAAGRVQPLRGLVLSRAIDQGVLAAASILLARALGPEAFAPLAVLFILNSLGVQVSDFGVGFRVLRADPGESIDQASLRQLRRANGVLAGASVALGLLVGGTVGAVIASGGVLWALTGEAYVRKVATLKVEGERRVVQAEIISSAVFAIGCALCWWQDTGMFAYGLVFAVKHLVEAALTAGGLVLFAPGASPARATQEWVGQVITYATANVDFLLVGLFLGASDVSQYVLAFRLASAAPALLGGPFTQATFIELSGAGQDVAQSRFDHVVRRAFLLGLVGSAVAGALALVLPPFLGGEWDEVRPILLVLAVAVPWRMLLGISVATALTAGRADAVVRWESMRLVLVTALVAAGAQQSVLVVAGAAALAGIVGIGTEVALAAHTRGLRGPRQLAPLGAVAVALVAGLVVLLG